MFFPSAVRGSVAIVALFCVHCGGSARRGPCYFDGESVVGTNFDAETLAALSRADRERTLAAQRLHSQSALWPLVEPGPPSASILDEHARGERGLVLTEVMVASLERQRGTFTHCMRNTRGAVTFEIIVNGDGSVGRARPFRSDLPQAALDCLIDAWTRVTFPAPIGGVPAKAIVPFVFR